MKLTLSLKGNPFKKQNFYRFQSETFCLHVPYKRLYFINHKEHGKVYPVFITDVAYNDKSMNIKGVSFKLFLLSLLNSYVFLCGIDLISSSFISNFFLYKPGNYILSLLINSFYFKSLIDRLSSQLLLVKNIYLKSNGKEVVIEKYYNNAVIKVDIGEIYFRNVFCKYQQKVRKERVNDNNSNSIHIIFKYGANKELLLKGKIKFCDFEILQSILNRYYIDTTQISFNLSKEESVPVKYSHIDRDIIKKKELFSYLKKSFLFENIKRKLYCMSLYRRKIRWVKDRI